MTVDDYHEHTYLCDIQVSVPKTQLRHSVSLLIDSLVRLVLTDKPGVVISTLYLKREIKRYVL